MTIGRRIAWFVTQGFASLGLAFAIVGQSILLLNIMVDTGWKVAAIAILAGLFLWLSMVIVRPSGKRRVFTPGSDKFADYYSRWWAQEGHLHVYCHDLEWLEGGTMLPALNQLIRKGKSGRATVYLRETGGKLVQEILGSGVKIVAVPESVAWKVRMSLVDDDTQRELIIRIKKSNGARGGRVVHQETTDSNLTNLAMEFFSSLEARS